MATKIKNTIKREKDLSYKDTSQYKYFKESILGKYEFDKFYDTGEVFIIKEPNRKIYYGLRKKIKFIYNPISMAGEIHEYYVDLKTGESKIIPYKEIPAIDDMITAESNNIKTLEKALEKYIPLDNFLYHSANKIKETVETMKNNKCNHLGLNILALRWDTKVIVNHKYIDKEKILIEHIVARLGLNDFFWKDINMEDLENQSQNQENNIFIEPTWNTDKAKWEEKSKSEIDKEFSKYFN